ncbi:MAG: hypothetical protein A2X94_16280 [Bdellovibrionales bacterium GWB1_55_8]|nr:MAG: hypothetical protein A2X94_16280 [Bdellovibrionales bacterium GWB1_55_8]
MRNLTRLVSIFVLLIVSNSALGASKKPLALIYKDSGSCFACEVGARAAAEDAGMKTRYISADEITPSLLKKAQLWIQPGGNAIDVAKRMDPKAYGYLKDYIEQGGNYLGYCAGAFFADYFVDNDNTIPGLGIIPGGVTKDYLPGDTGAHILPVRWHRNDKTFVRHLFFGEGPVFVFETPGTVEIIGEYVDNEASAPPIAVVQFKHGKGNVVLTAIHPEVPAWARWYYGLEDPDGSDRDLAVELVNRALFGKPSQQ